MHETPKVWVPLAQLGNVLILPGIPHLFKSMVDANKGLFAGPLMSSAAVYTLRGEGDLAAALGEIAARHPAVSIGSYPNVSPAQEHYKTRLCFDSRDGAAIAAALAEVRAALPVFDSLPAGAA